MKKILVTGSAGLIGSESVKFFVKKGFEVHGIDNNMRMYFFGKDASTEWSKKQLIKEFKDSYHHHHNIDIRDFEKLRKLFKENIFDLIIHTAAQPSHDWAVKEPLTDFSINAVGTHNLLELYRLYSPEAVFIFTSTNKVYGDSPNNLPLIEKKTRYELPKTHKFYKGINESMSIDNSKHSIFGASKVAADVMVQEYGKYFGLKTGIFRGGCVTGPAHSGAKLHGFLAYLIKCINSDVEYTIFGYKGKQVRDNIHSHDLANAFYHFYKAPGKGVVYNIGGSRHSNISILEAVGKIEKILRKKAKIKYSSSNRIGDHIWYISDISKFRKNYPKWEYEYDNDKIIEEICRNN
ncbi:MAG: NAD-dependent epimerase [Candidatus Levybacteria bacterium CG_4_10_14_0_2_um_filter_36_16]|nr:MAG: NAD-dependent epimerase [Candidatus Levybacteria bacterium CG2_30_37_29]PIR78848.1 MAG: NAD-dependent epimerase [Candidatus Levybacteria bacterium CG10_big_fil_rev_8_21_14_0_10_36_30]PIZ97442.1 MAG: NAD-dependent epimerase [Candidatus Levybacteria bacterium CG_4_10_14_0_2_um_filter_36_16]